MEHKGPRFGDVFNEENLLNKTDPKCITNCGKMVSR
jgi:hypothetical protein